MKNIAAASIIAFAALFATTHMAANAVNARDARLAATMQHQEMAQAQTWLVTATITDADGKVLVEDALYYRQDSVRFPDEGACRAFVASDDKDLAAANESLTAQMIAAFGEGTKVVVSCSIEPSE